MMNISVYMCASQMTLVIKNPPANAQYARDIGSVPELERSPEIRNGNPIQGSCLENPVA